MAATYREQYDRMRRWYNRWVALDEGKVHEIPSDNYVDDIYAFFLNCYHLKDWIKDDGTVATNIQEAVETHINSNRALKLCADICNSLKHLHLKSSRSGETLAFGRKQFGLDVGAAPTIIKLKYEVNTSTGPIDAFQLATDCIGAWDAFLNANGLR
jgi:hypothetical protein